MNIAYTTREKARSLARVVNAKAPARLKAPVKDTDGLWIFPGLSHKGGTLSLKK